MAAPTRTQITQNVTQPVFRVEIDTGSGYETVPLDTISVTRDAVGDGDIGTIPFVGTCVTEQFSVTLRYADEPEISVDTMTPIRVWCAWSLTPVNRQPRQP